MDGQTGHGQQVPVQIDQTAFHTRFSADNDAARHGQGPVHPGIVNHTAVTLGGQTGILGVAVQPVPFDGKGGDIAVGGCHAPGRQRFTWQAKRNQAALIAGDIILTTGSQGPGAPLFQTGETGLIQQIRGSGHGVEGAGTAVQKGHGVFQGCHTVPPFLSFFHSMYKKGCCNATALGDGAYLDREASMASAAFLPAPMARMTVAAPVTASPPA